MNESEKMSGELFKSLRVRKSVEGLFELKAVDNSKSIDPFVGAMPDIE